MWLAGEIPVVCSYMTSAHIACKEVHEAFDYVG